MDGTGTTGTGGPTVGRSNRMDAIELEVIYNATNQIAFELTQKLMRNGYSSIVKESQDLALSICDREGRNVGQYSPNPVGLGVVGAQLTGILRDFADDIGEGDAFILNHPYRYCQNHPSDVTLIAPVFHEGRLAAFVGNTAHKPDIGGKAPGTNAGDATEVFQEGLLIPPLKLYRGGVLDEGLKQLICANTRTPEVTWGDIRAQVQANLHGIERLAALFRRFGVDDVLACWEERIAITEKELRSRIAALPPGAYGPVTDYIDDDGVELDKPLAVAVTLHVRGDELEFAFASARQSRGPLNLRPCVVRAVAEYCVQAALGPDLPKNQGCSAPVRITLPAPGHLLNPEFPAPVNMYATTCHRLAPVIMTALAQAVPDRVAAPQSSSGGAVSFNGRAPGSQRRYSQYEILWGGYGARPDKDGVSGCAADISNVMSTPVEALENEFPVRMKCFEVNPDSAGAGRRRGGLGIRRAWEVLADDVTLNLRLDRFKHSSPGLFGARPSALARCTLNPGAAGERPLHSKAANVRLSRGDTVLLELGGGGGWGDPLTREPERVLDDVRNGYVSPAAARDLYGVVIDPRTLTVDAAATRRQRKETGARAAHRH